MPKKRFAHVFTMVQRDLHRSLLPLNAINVVFQHSQLELVFSANVLKYCVGTF